MVPAEASRRRRSRRRARVRRMRAALGATVLLAAGTAALLAVDSMGGRRPPAAAPPKAVVAQGRVRSAGAAPAPAPRPLRLPSPLPSRRLTVPILMYHRVDRLTPALPAMTRALTVDPGAFAAEMRWLVAHGWHAITQEQLFAALEHGARLPAKPIVITFDDGYRDVWGKASPILHRLHLHATAYVITDRVSGPDPSFLTWPQLRLLEQRGIEIGSHTVHHLELTQLSDGAAWAELTDSKRALEAHLHHPVQWFSYPAGRFDARTVQLVERAGYVLAVTTRPGAVQDARAPLELHRFEVLDTTGVAGLASLLRGVR